MNSHSWPCPDTQIIAGQLIRGFAEKLSEGVQISSEVLVGHWAAGVE